MPIMFAAALDLVTFVSYGVPVGIFLGSVIGTAIGTTLVQTHLIGASKMTEANVKLADSHRAVLAAENELAEARRRNEEADRDSCRERLEAALGRVAELEARDRDRDARLADLEGRLADSDGRARRAGQLMEEAWHAFLGEVGFYRRPGEGGQL